MNADTVPALIRTYVPLALSVLFGWLATLGIQIDDSAQAALASGIGAVLAGVYYTAVRWAAKRWPWVEWLLGSAKAPVYTEGTIEPAADMHTARPK